MCVHTARVCVLNNLCKSVNSSFSFSYRPKPKSSQPKRAHQHLFTTTMYEWQACELFRKLCYITYLYNSRQCDKMLIDLIKSAKNYVFVSMLPMEFRHSSVNRTYVSFPQPENHFCAANDRINTV